MCFPYNISRRISSVPQRSAFSTYQRPSLFTGRAPTDQLCATLGSTTFDEDDDNGSIVYDDRDDTEWSNEFPSIHRTFSFDEDDDQEDDLVTPPVSPHFFRFDDWDEERFDTIDTDIAPVDAKRKSSTLDWSTLHTKSIDSIFQEYHNSSSTCALLPHNFSSYSFRPIRDGNSLFAPVDTTSAAPTVSLHSDDDLSISERHLHVRGVDVIVPECPSIPRIGGEDEQDLRRPSSRSIHIYDGPGEEADDDEASPCESSSTSSYVPPIPKEIIIISKKPKGRDGRFCNLFMRLSTLRRSKNGTTHKKHRNGGKRRNHKGRRGEF